MLKKLRHTFIVTNMLFASLALLATFALVLVASYHQHEDDISYALEIATSNTAFSKHPSSDETTPHVIKPEDLSSILTDDTSSTNLPQSSVLPENNYPDKNAPFIATSSYLVFGDDREIHTLSDPLELDKTTYTTAIGLALARYERTATIDTQGTLSDFGLIYKVNATPDGLKVAFASTSYLTQAMTSLVITLIGVGICALCAFGLISIFLSRWTFRPVERAWKQQQQFIADASHELKTPLTVILANTSILLSHTDGAITSHTRWIESTETEAHLMRDLIDDMLFLAQPESQRRCALRMRIDVSELTKRNILQFESLAFEKNLDLIDAIEENIFMQGDTLQIQRLVSTLIDNACKYSNPASKIHIRLTGESGHLRLSVNNQGFPIPAEDLPYLFDRFYRVDKARVREEGGFGLGLAIAKNIVEEHGGTIAAQSSVVDGTTFTIMLPKD
ncbi:MAG: HAMP domain-containing sensor histidine kinase [Raoultibacter sp.]